MGLTMITIGLDINVFGADYNAGEITLQTDS